MDIIVGYSGFVGSNIASGHRFDASLNSKNISQAFYTNPDLCVYAGIPAEKYLAAKDPETDMNFIRVAISNIEKINPKRIVLISTIDVYPKPVGVDEASAIDESKSHPYGAHRRLIEKWVTDRFPDSLIVRLPALFGTNIKKNFIYDLVHIIPSVLSATKYEEISNEPIVRRSYELQQNGMYKCIVPETSRKTLKEYFMQSGFSALNFTDSRARYQYYNLRYIWEHIKIALYNNVRVVNFAVESLSAGEIHKEIRGEEFVNEFSKDVMNYDFVTKYDDIFGGSNGYIFPKEKVIADLRAFVFEEETKQGK